MRFVDCPDVRIAVPEDADAIMALLRLAHDEAGEHPLSERKVRIVVDNGVVRNGGLIGVVGEIGGPIKAALILRISDVWYSEEKQLLELSNFVHPDHRRSTYAKQLIDFAKHCSDGISLDLMIGVFSNERTEAKVKLYARRVTPRGAFFCHKPGA